MAERRSKRRARSSRGELLARAEASPRDRCERRAASMHAGATTLDGDPSIAAILEGALRHRERVERVTHGFHAWPAGLHPDTARALLSLADGPVLDPFCGGGTVLVEALLAGREALGCDINPVALLVARARTALTTEEDRTALRVGARRAAEAGRNEGFGAANWAVANRRDPGTPDGVAPVLRDWHEPHVLWELSAIRAAIGTDPLLRAVLSSILVKCSFRESDTSARRIEGARPPGTAATLFHKKAREYARALQSLAEAVPEGEGRPRARVHRVDARELREDPRFGLVLCSPPYPGVYDYLPLQTLRMAWLGLTGDESAEIGSRRDFRRDPSDALRRWRADTGRWVRAAHRAMRPGGRMAVVIGDGFGGGQVIDSLAPLTHAAEQLGLRRVARATTERWDAGVEHVRPEHAVLFERPT